MTAQNRVNKTNATMTLYEMQNGLTDAVFERIKEHFENDDGSDEENDEGSERFVGEMTEEHYNDAIDDIKYEETDYLVSTTYQGGVNELLCEYGIDNAIKLYYDEYDSLQKVTSRALMFNILVLTIKTTYDDYITWLNK